MIVLSLALLALDAAQAPAPASADTVSPAAAIETPYTIQSGALALGGTLTVPRGATGRVPVAVIIAGSGPTDRNGNSVMGIRPNSYAQLAWRLAERGIATLRYDKRGMPGTQGTFELTRMTLEDFAADARAAAASLARDSRFSRVVLVGHSEGASTFLRSVAVFDPPAAIRAVRSPILIVQGETDLQATVADAERLHAARPDARFVVIPEVNHVLKQVADRTLAGQMRTYQDPTVPITPAAVAAIADWIQALGDGP